MSESNRRQFFHATGFAAAGSLLLPASVRPTPPSGEHEDVHAPMQDPQDQKLVATAKNIEGPYFRAGAPYHAKVSPPCAPGKVLVVRGRVWGIDTRKPLAGACIHIWQASHAGRYDNDDPKQPPKAGEFAYRARMLTDDLGRYSYETIHPGRYLNGKTYRPAHIHYRVEAPGYQTLITQLYFKGDPFLAKDRFVKESLVIQPKVIAAGDASYRSGAFDIVLAKA